MDGTRQIAVTVAAASLLLACAGLARAGDYDDESRKTVHVSAGLFVPRDADVRDGYGTVWGMATLSYDVPAGPRATHRLSLGFAQGSRKLDSGFLESYFNVGLYRVDAKFQMIPLTYTLLATPAARSGGAYIGAGGGVYFGRSEVSRKVVYGSLEDTQSADWWATRFGLHAVAGASFPGGLTAEVRYTKMLDGHTLFEYQGTTARAKIDGWSFALGYRF